MSSEHEYECIVLGLGAMGSSVACHLALEGRRVLGLDMYNAPPNPQGSSRGLTRVIREITFEGDVYFDLVQQAYAAWSNLQREAGELPGPPKGRLLIPTGALYLAQADTQTLDAARALAAKADRLHAGEPACEILADSAAVRAKCDALADRPGLRGVWEPRAGALWPEGCIEAFQEVARKHGAQPGSSFEPGRQLSTEVALGRHQR